jgi:hypothetical protein
MRTTRTIRGAALALAGLFALGAAGPPAAADGPSGFAVGGYARLSIGRNWESLRLFVDGSDRIVVVHKPEAQGSILQVQRFLPDGRTDEGYGTDGSTTVPFLSPFDESTVPTVAPDGSVYVRDFTIGGTRLRRITPSGGLDGSYGLGGEVLGGGSLGSDGSIFRASTMSGSWYVRRYGPGGSLDPAFGTGGTAPLAVCDGPGDGGTATVQPLDDGSVLATCQVGGVDARVHLDPSGAVFGSRIEEGSAASRLDLAADGGLVSTRVVAGAVEVRRLSSALVPDPGFSGDGVASVPGAAAEVVVSGARTYLVTQSSSGPGLRRRTARVAAVGTEDLDPAFGVDGLTTIEVGLHDQRTVSLEIQTGFAPSDGGGLVVTSAAFPTGPAASEFDFDARVRQIAPSGAIRSEVRAPIVLDPAPLAGHGAVVALSTIVASLDTQTDAVRRFDLAPMRIAPFATASAFAQQLSADVRGRAATGAEVAAFEQAIADGVPAAVLVGEALAEPGWASALEPTARLYGAYFGRLPDPTGLRYWMAKRASGTTVARMSAVFADSSEFKRTYGSLTNRQFVELVYRNVLGRAGDPSGVTYWTGKLDRRATSRGHLMASFSESSEHVRRRGPEVAVVSRFLALLGRTPSASELAVWTGATPMGDADAVTRFLVASDAYADRVG